MTLLDRIKAARLGGTKTIGDVEHVVLLVQAGEGDLREELLASLKKPRKRKKSLEVPIEGSE